MADSVVNFESLSGPELVALYNRLATKLKMDNVKRFADRQSGVVRIKQLLQRCDLHAVSITDLLPAAAVQPEAAREQPVELQTKGATPCVPEDNASTQDNSPPVPQEETVAVTVSSTTPVMGCDDCLGKFKSRDGTIRHKILQVLCARFGNDVALGELVEVGYGLNAVDGASAIKMVLKGVQWMIDKEKLNIELRRTKNGTITYYGLHSSPAG